MATRIKKVTKPFNEWQAEEVEKTFGITRVETLELLEDLLAVKAVKEHPLHTTLEAYRKEANWLIDAWNEDEYKFLFIGPFMKLVNFASNYCNVFTQRPMTISYENDTKVTSGKVEWMLAKGRQIPEQPHFFLHEYKPEKNRDNDPLGQLLIAMIGAQQLNSNDSPIYGIYVNGRNWFIVLLDGTQYATSAPFVITTNDIFDLFAILNHLRDKMVEIYKKL
jgi:hypothetical protein